MSDTRPRLRPEHSDTDTAAGATPGRPAAQAFVAAGLIAALWAIVAGLVCVTVPVLVAWAADGRSGSGAPDALRASAHVWLLTHNTRVSLSAGEFGLPPVGLLILPLLLLARAGGHAARQVPVGSLAAAAALTATVAAPYALAATAIAGLSSSVHVQPHVTSALSASAVAAALGAGAGVLRASQLGAPAWTAVPQRARQAAGPVAAAVGVLLAAGALLAGASLGLHAGDVGAVLTLTAPGVVGTVGVGLLSLAYLPVAVVWASCWWAGPGFAVGVGTTVGPFGVTLGAVPAFPLFAALPEVAPPWWIGMFALGVPLMAGAVAGLVAERGGRATWRELAVIGPGAGVLMTGLCWLCSGPVGGGRLTDVGPSAWRVGLAVAVAVTAGALLTGPVRRLLTRGTRTSDR